MRILLGSLLVSGILFSGCNTSSQREKYAEAESYYYEFYDSARESSSQKLIQEMAVYMQRPFDYILTEESAAKGWPYYGDVPRGTRVKREIIMPPHSTVHRVEPLSQYKNDKPAKMLEITILSLDSVRVEVKFRLFKGKAGQWIRIVNQPEHYYPLKEKRQEELVEEISKAAIRNTFK